MATEKTKIGIIGCGNIAHAYMTAGQRFDNIEIVACSDLDMDRAKAKAEEHGIPNPCTVSKLLCDPDIEIIVNLTIPKVHAEIAIATLEAGKHAYSEKPFAVTREDGLKVLQTAADKGLRCGCAPDTFLGGGIQTCRKLIDDGWIGKPIGATAFMMGHGPERWHPDPDFFYQTGGGPLFDMGPYYLTCLTNLLGATKSVSAAAGISFAERITGSGAHKDEIIKVNTPTHVNGIMEFAMGAVGTITTSFDVWGSEHRNLEIYGSEGTLLVPDPNGFGGPVRIKRQDHEGFIEVPLTHGYTEQNRGIGVADMALAIKSGRPHRASGDLAYHVLVLMHAFYDASRERRYVDLQSKVERPAALPVGLTPGKLEL
jgi:predicted dehydrogenase